MGQAAKTYRNVSYSDICFGDPKDNNLNKLMSKVLLPLPTELADGLRLEGVSLKYEISPKIWFLRSPPRFDFIEQLRVGED